MRKTFKQSTQTLTQYAEPFLLTPLIRSHQPLPQKSILITGGSGFLGIQLLHLCLNNPDYTQVFTIVRSKNRLCEQWFQ